MPTIFALVVHVLDPEYRNRFHYFPHPIAGLAVVAVALKAEDSALRRVWTGSRVSLYASPEAPCPLPQQAT